MNGELLLRNDIDIRVRGFRDNRAARGTYLNAATGTWEVRTAKYPGGTNVANGVMGYVAGSNGDYVGGLDDTVVLTEGTDYYLRVTLEEGGITGDWERLLTAQLRDGRNALA